MELKDIRVHDVVAVTQHQRVNEDGTLGGHAWYCEKAILGVVVELDGAAGLMTVIRPNRESLTYNLVEGEKDYTFTVGAASEVEYAAQIEKEIAAQRVRALEEHRQLIEIEKWRDDFRDQVSLMGKLVRFARSLGRV